MSRVAIIGWAQSPLEERMAGLHKVELISSTVMSALKHAGISIDNVDTVIDSSCDVLDGVSISNVFTVESMGAFLKEESKVEEDGAYALLYAYLRILAGPSKIALVVAAGKPSDSSPQSYSFMMGDPFFLKPLGMDGISSAALQARNYMDAYGIGQAHADKVVLKNRMNGNRNPRAQIREKITPGAVSASPMVSSPLRLCDLPPVTDGCSVAILAEEKTAIGLTRDPVWIQGMGYCQEPYYPGHRNLQRSESLVRAARMAYKEAGVKDPRKDADLAEVSEPSSVHELMIYEGLGLCREGEGKRLIDEGVTAADGPFPVNLSGGALCGNPIMVTGLIRIIEVAAQLKREAGSHQVRGIVRRGIAHGSSGLFLQSNIVCVLGKDGQKQTGPVRSPAVHAGRPVKKRGKRAPRRKPAGKTIKKAVSRYEGESGNGRGNAEETLLEALRRIWLK